MISCLCFFISVLTIAVCVLINRHLKHLDYIKREINVSRFDIQSFISKEISNIIKNFISTEVAIKNMESEFKEKLQFVYFQSETNAIDRSEYIKKRLDEIWEQLERPEEIKNSKPVKRAMSEEHKQKIRLAKIKSNEKKRAALIDRSDSILP